MGEMRGAQHLAEFILAHYCGRVVEVGVGYQGDVACRLQSLDLVATDRSGRDLDGLTVVGDDVFSPRLELYQGASLLYSIRPPLEIQVAMGRLARQVGADVLVRPLGDEIADLPGFVRTLVNHGQARFYLFKPL
ncbi:MAG: hypothetical protein GKC10_01495 [Methanosarcinales archaeon]|nr:hypothetical protein [Methanosarcinales archaeon]